MTSDSKDHPSKVWYNLNYTKKTRKYLLYICNFSIKYVEAPQNCLAEAVLIVNHIISFMGDYDRLP